MEFVILKSISSEALTKEENYLRELYKGEIDMDNFLLETDILKTIFKDSKPECFKDVLDKVKKLSKSQLVLIPNTVKICHLLLVNPATTATAKRSFSMAWHIKTWTQSTMTPKRFNALAILHTHKSFADALNLIEVAKEFIENSDSRKLIFGSF